MQKEKVSILIFTFDPYSVCWPAFCHGLNKYWPDCPYDVYFITNYKSPPCGTAIKVGDDNVFTSKMHTALSQIDTPYIIYMHEDNWIDRPVNAEAIYDYIELMEQDKADYIRLIPVPGPNYDYPDDERLGIIAQDAPYRTSLMAALWRKSVLEEMLIEGESIWAFENFGGPRSHKYGERFLCVKKRRFGISYVVTAVQDGEWSPDARKYAKEEGLTVDFAALPSVPWRKWVRTRLYRTSVKFRNARRFLTRRKA